jgi:hypothetical protein
MEPSSPSWPRPRRVRAGVLLDAAGMLGLPLGIGLVGGFWIADRGVSWLPTMLSLVLTVAAASLLLVGAGYWLKGRTHAVEAGGRRLRRRVVAVLALAALAFAGRLAVWWVTQPSPLTARAAADRATAFAADARRYRDYDRGLELLLRRLESDSRLRPGDHPLAHEEEALLLDAWEAAYDQAFALDQVRRFWEDWYRFDPSRRDRAAHVDSFLLTYAAELALYEKSYRLARVIGSNPTAARFLDAPHPARGLPPGSFSWLREQLQGSRDQARVQAGARYLAWLGTGLAARAEADARGSGWLWRAIDAHLTAIGGNPALDRAVATVAGDLQLLRGGVHRLWFPTQKGVAEWMGDARTRRIGWYLIAEPQLAAVEPQLQPGDVLLSRKNWYLSNVGLPGFWPHAILHVGTPAELRATFDVPEVRAWVRAEIGEDAGLDGLLARRHPVLWQRYLGGADGHPYRVVEAISEGVVFNTLPHAAGDYLAALRPRLPPLARAQAIAAAFDHLEKPYDFDFDFATDHALVCTELVWRAYRPGPGKAGLTLPVAPLAGRQTLPANAIARLYAEERGRPDRQLDFVWFLDGRERERRAVPAGEEAFAASWRRPKWDVAQR